MLKLTSNMSRYSHSAAVPDKSNEEYLEADYDYDEDTYGNASVTESSVPIAGSVPNVTATSTTIATTTIASEMLADSGAGKYKYQIVNT